MDDVTSVVKLSVHIAFLLQSIFINIYQTQNKYSFEDLFYSFKSDTDLSGVIC